MKASSWLRSTMCWSLLPTDREAFLSLAGNKSMSERISVLNNGVDLNYFCPDDIVQRDQNCLVVSGKLSYHANVNMVLFLVNEIMPNVWKERPETRLVIVGKDPSRDILSLGENPQIIITGTVKDIRPYLRQATIAVTPITYGAGIQNKVLEAMACGTPVISTSKAVSALAVRPGQDLLVEDQPHQFAKAILRLLDDPEKQQSLGIAGRLFVEKHHNWDKITSQLEVMYNRVIDERRQIL
jgi:polysaccharide biosynthesis protein PslH